MYDRPRMSPEERRRRAIAALRREGRELVGLAVGALTTLVAWVVFLGLRVRSIPFGSDARQLDWPAIVEIQRSGGDASRVLYRASWFGGARFFEVVGANTPLRLFSALGLPPAAAMAASTLVAQAFLAHLAVVAIDALRERWGLRARAMGLPERVGVSLAVSFMPWIGIRLYAGHLSLVESLLAFAVPSTLLLLAREGRSPSWVTWGVAVAAIAAVVEGANPQLNLYSAFFGGLLLVPVLWEAARRPAALAVAVAIVVGAAALAAPSLAVLLRNGSGADSARQAGGEVVTWWHVMRSREWATVFTAGDALFRGNPSPGRFHEAQIPLGLGLLGLLAVPLRRERWLLASLFGVAALIVLFSMRVEPVSSALLALVPPFRLMRVPARAAGILAVMTTVLALAALGDRASPPPPRPRDGRRTIFALGGATWLLGLAVAPAWASELLSLLTVLGLAIARRVRGDALRALPPHFAIFVVGVASLASTAHLLPEPITEAQLRAPVVESAAELRRLGLLPRHALDRVFDDDPGPAGPNVYAASELPTAFAYGFPSRRQTEAFAAIQAQPLYSATHVLTPVAGPDDAGTRALLMLYNVRAWIHADLDRRTAYPMPTPGPVWFPAGFARTERLEQLGEALRANASSPARFASVAVLDPGAAPPFPLDAACARSTGVVAETPEGGQRIEIDVASTGDCLMVVSTNWTSRHHASFRGEGGERALEVAPIDRTLVGVRVPKGVGRVSIGVAVEAPRWARGLPWVGAGLLLLAGWLATRRTLAQLG